MKVSFKNLGQIQYAELDLRPFTAIIGPNNTNKTYIAYSLYGLLSNSVSPFQEQFQLDAFRRKNVKKKQTEVKKKQSEEYVTITRTLDTVRNNCNIRLDDLVRRFSHSLDNYFQDSSHRIFHKTEYQAAVSRKDVQADIEYFTQHNLADSYIQSMTIHDNHLSIAIDPVFKKYSNLPQSYYFDAALNYAVMPQPFLLPAERNALIITYKLLANRRYKFLKDMQRDIRFLPERGNERHRSTSLVYQRQMEMLRDQGDIRYPQPIEDFLDFLTDIELETPSKSTPANSFSKLADDIERNLLANNRIKYTTVTPLRTRELKVEVKEGLDIDLYNASSSIKQLTPLLLYLRNRARPGQILMVDEPEMNLHPESQVRLLEALAILVNLGVKVLITTHSAYFMAHLNNLVLSAATTPRMRRKIAQELYSKDERSFLRLEDVSAYEMRDNTLVSLKDDDYGIRWDTLSDVSSEVQHKFFKIAELRNEKSN